MALTINTNVPSLVARNNLNKNVSGLEKAMQQLSTGNRINNAGDDAAGLTIAEKIKAQVGGSKKAADNIQDAKNFINVAEGGMISIGNHLQRINELLVQAASDMYDNEGRKAILTEVNERIKDIDIIARGHQFNGKTILDGSLTQMVIQIGAGKEVDPANPINTLDIGKALRDCHVSKLGSGATGGIKLPTGLNPDDASTFGVDVDGSGTGTFATNTEMGDKIREYMTEISAAITQMTESRGLLGAYTNRLDSTYDNISMTVENLETARSRITDTDVAQASSEMVRYQILQQTTTATLVQANQIPSLALSLIG